LKFIARLLSFFSLGLSALNRVCLRNTPVVLLTLLKLPAGALSPLLALAGAVGAALGLARRDPVAVGAGSLGAALAVGHVRRVTKPHDAFAEAFGRDWPAQIPARLRPLLHPSRYAPLPPDPPEVPWQRDVVIGVHHETGDPLLADLWEPPAGVPRTGLAVIYLHGSAWHYMDKDFAGSTRRFFRHLAAQGHVVLDVAYTLAPKAQLLPMLADVKRAIAWMKENAAAYQVSPQRIVLVGGSAGGHLSLLAAYTANRPDLQPADVTGDTSVRGVVSYYGISDLAALNSTLFHIPYPPGTDQVLTGLRLLPPGAPPVPAEDLVAGLLGGTPEEQPELCRLGSPITHVGRHCPPTLLLHGTHDFGLDPEVQSGRLHAALRAAGVPSVYVELADSDHAFDLFFTRLSPAFQASLYDTERFLALLV
jgi:acetyl esterase/lipase